jgi:two-component system, chemotaxis family, sensor kinase CheA
MKGTTPSFKIICVDDETDLLDIYCHMIEMFGFEAILCSSVDEALVKIEKHSQELVLVISDYQMPRKTGFDLRTAMMTEWKDIPFVICSAQVTREMALSAVDLKISGFIDKPVVPENFKEIIQKTTQDRINDLNDERELKEGFIGEADQLIEELEPLIISLDDEASPDVLNRIFAIIHTIKGTSAFFKPDIISKFTHKLEDFFAPFKKEECELNAHAIGVLLKGIDTIKILVRALESGTLKNHTVEEYLDIFSEKKAEKKVEKSAEAVQPKNTQKAPEAAAREEVRVGIDVLNEFMELSGEITVIRNMINKHIQRIEMEFGANKNINLLSELLEEMYKINSSLQDKILEIRKVPMKNIYRPLNRTLRDLGVSLQKDFAIDFKNQDMKVDTSLAEVLSASLIHMVRNCADHGIETKAVRKEMGKPDAGKIILNAKQSKDEIVVELSDDGKGLNAEFLRKKIIEKGLRTEEQAAKMSDNEVQGMIFEPGFSTAEKVTDVSGRGVGMDMVKQSIKKIGGRIDIDSTVGKGTTFSIHLPIPKSVMIVPSVLVRSVDDIFAIPQENVIRLLNLKENMAEIRTLEGVTCLLYQEHLLPVIELDKIFKADTNKFEDASYAVIVNVNDQQYAILVNEIIDLEDTVVKKLGAQFSSQTQYMGATFLADGKVGLILDVQGLAEKTGINCEKVAVPKVEKETVHSDDIEKNLLLFRTGHNKLYGIEFDEIFRLEEFSRSSIKYSGEQPTLIYRDSVIPVQCFTSFIGETKRHEIPEKSFAIILKEEDKHCAVLISEIVDLVRTSFKIDDFFADENVILGASIINNQTVTLVNPAKVVEMMLHKKVMIDDDLEDGLKVA